MFDQEPDGDPHGECAAEISMLTERLNVALNGQTTLAALVNKMEAERDAAREELKASQQNALAEARLRIISRLKHVEGWTRHDTTYMINANWDGIAEGLSQARRIIGAMWDDLPVSKPQAVEDHEDSMRVALSEPNSDSATGACSTAPRQPTPNRREPCGPASAPAAPHAPSTRLTFSDPVQPPAAASTRCGYPTTAVAPKGTPPTANGSA